MHAPLYFPRKNNISVGSEYNQKKIFDASDLNCHLVEIFSRKMMSLQEKIFSRLKGIIPLGS